MVLYIDPSVTTYIIQAVAAIVIAGGAVISVFWRKAKKKVSKTLNIDENSKKEVEDEIQEIDAATDAAKEGE
ncbi:MAG TPA: hypothetical protein DEO83_00535 [Lachnospiraceae bacterium]|jgi:uncharacterized protein YoxC|nr:hypothetical protein [Lachnospiraceae bacterium]